MNQKSIKISNQTAAQTIPFVVLQDSWVQLSYGWVMALESRDAGLYGQIKWSKAGNELLENAQPNIPVLPRSLPHPRRNPPTRRRHWVHFVHHVHPVHSILPFRPLGPFRPSKPSVAPAI